MKRLLELHDIKQKIDSSFIDKGWVMVFSFSHNFEEVDQGGVYCALVKAEKLNQAMNSYNWDLRYGNGRPGFVTSFKSGEENSHYYRYDDPNIEPLVYYREELGQRDNYLEFSEEFRLYHNLYEDFKSHTRKEYIYTNSNGDEEVVAKIGKNEAFVKLKFIKDFISAKEMELLIFFDFMRFSEKKPMELELSEIDKTFKFENTTYWQLLTDVSDRSLRNNKTQSWIMGKTVIRKISDYKPNIWGTIEGDDKYVEFIYGYDENGDEAFFTCDEEQLGNYFGKNQGAPLYVTPVYFKKDVLKKYYDNPTKYSVDDGRVSCNSLWSLRLDNSCKDYVIVLLGDLGKLHHNEQLYWKSYNIAPQENGFSHTAYKRFFEGIPSDPESPDLYLKMKLHKFNEDWTTKFGWTLFKPLSEEDFHYFKSFHLLTTDDNDKEFDEQILSLTKIFIDSLNVKELGKGISFEKENVGSIDKFEAFLKNMEWEIPEMIVFFRQVQSLRSSTVAHRRNTQRKSTKKVLEYFDFQNKNLSDVLLWITESFIKTLNTLDEHIIKK